jgi:AcrR family transcriptional regulator
MVEAAIRKPGEELGPRANRTIARIEEATREILLARGYAGTTIDDVTRTAGVSRASFYTYFPSKRDVLLSLGAESIRAAVAIVKDFESLPVRPRLEDLRGWVREYFRLLDGHGSFSFAWTQAALEDAEIRQAGIVGHLRLCRRMGDALGAARGKPYEHPAEQGLLVFSMLERGWSYAQVYRDVLDLEQFQDELADALAVHLRRRRT